MKAGFLLSVATATLIFSSAVAGATTYTSVQHIGDATVDFSLTTDGVIGAVSQSDVTAFNIDITDRAGSVDLTDANSRLDFYAETAPLGSNTSALTATPTALQYNFDSPGFGFAYFYEAASVTQTPFYCLSTSGCFAGQNGMPAIGVSTQQGNSPIDQIAESGVVTIASAAPEPSDWALMLLGIGGIGYMFRRAKKAYNLTFARSRPA
jgi:hypothetical protein